MVSLCGSTRLLLFSYKETSLFITVSLILFLQSSAITWTKTPANPVSGTLGKNVTLEWNYTLTSTNVLDYFVLLKFQGRSSTKIMKYEKSEIRFYDSFSEKVVLLQRGTPSFMLLNLKMDDKAEYCCEVNTRPSANVMQGHSEVNCTQLIILEPPTITVLSPNQTVNESNDVRLSCHASGTPPPSITWSKASNEEKTLNSSTVLSLKNINRNQDGLYQCIANNGPGKAIASVRVTVHCKYRLSVSRKC
ncbi:limbic system-associated membrane protein-like [Montipora capricornis]|uniref:limbic system-associated membrane protein-like n=1 Tax=Montipora capricornis TaxID=246305 RepID=UPI0035F170F7